MQYFKKSEVFCKLPHFPRQIKWLTKNTTLFKDKASLQRGRFFFLNIDYTYKGEFFDRLFLNTNYEISTDKQMRRTLFLLLTIGSLLGGLLNTSFALDADKIFPDSTKGFFSIQNTTELVQRWEKTQLGLLLQRPEMKEFAVDLRQQLGQRISTRFGLSLDDIRLVPSGEVAAGVVAPVGQTPGIVFLFDVTEKIPETRAFLVELEKIFVQRKAKKNNVTIIGETASVFTFPSARDDVVERRAVYLLTGNYLIISDQIYLIELISRRIKGERSRPLAEQPAYVKVIQRCKDDLLPEDTEPIMRWFIHPLELGEAIRSIANSTLRRNTKSSPFEVLAHVGFDAIHGIGGTIDLKAGNLEVVHRTNIFAPKPYRESMKMLAFINDSDMDPPSWMPNHVASGTSVSLNPLEVFDNFGPLFDSMVIEADRGGWDEILRSMKEDPFGLQIDVRNELVQMLGQKVVYFTHYKMPITTESEKVLVAITIREGKTEDVYKALQKLITDEDMDFEQRRFQDFQIWQKRDISVRLERPKIDLVGGPPLPGNKKAADNKADKFQENRGDQFFPKGAFTIAADHLLFSNDAKYLEYILTRDPSKEELLQGATDFQAILKEFESTGLSENPRFIQSFARSADSIRPTYEMIRQGKLPESKSILAQGINMLLTPPDFEDEVRPSQIDGRKMPPFESIKQYFGPSGLVGVAESDGWFLKGFSIKQP